jgi:hypothetical protein
MQLYEQISVYSIDASDVPLKPGFSLCRPTKPEEVSDLTGNKALAEKRFHDLFQTRLSGLVEMALDRPMSPNSPIMEAIQAVSVSYLQPNQRDTQGRPRPERLIIVSDMLENGSGGSHYQSVPHFEDYKSGTAYTHLRSDLSGVKVTILYLRRDTGASVQGRSHIDFWDAWFEDQGATLDEVKTVEG